MLARDSARLRSRLPRVGMPLTGVFLFMYTVTLVLFSPYPSTSLIATALGFALALVFAVELVRERRSFVFPAPLLWFATFLCYCTFQMIWSPGSLAMLLTLFQLLVFAVILVNYSALGIDATAIEYAVYFAVACTFIYILIAQPAKVGGRVASTLVNPNAYSFVLMAGVLLAFRRMLTESLKGNFSRKFVAAFIPFVSLSVYGIVYLAGSRKGIITTIAASVVVVLYWLWQQPIRRRMLVSLAVAILFALLGYTLYRSPQFSRIVPLTDYLQGRNVGDTSIIIRSQMLEDATNLWLQRPFTGWGLDQFRVVSGWGTYSHDNYVELLANGGLVGLLLYFMVYVSAFASLIRSFRLSRDRVLTAYVFWAMTVLGVLAAWDLAAVSYYEKFNWVMLGVVIGVASYAAAEARSQSPRAI
jgi:O-antigen ligase